jgi:hypothetical protein
MAGPDEVSVHAGKKCDLCDGHLRQIADRQPQSGVISYECDGPLRHRWSAVLEASGFKLVPAGG